MGMELGDVVEGKPDWAGRTAGSVILYQCVREHETKVIWRTVGGMKEEKGKGRIKNVKKVNALNVNIFSYSSSPWRIGTPYRR